MILNDLEYQTTKDRLEGFKRALAKLNKNDELKTKNYLKWQMNIDGLLCMIDDFTSQINEYERLINTELTESMMFVIDSLEEVPKILIKVRIASKMSQQELADQLRISLAKLQQYEEREYEQATLAELLEVSEVLGIKVKSKTCLYLSRELSVA